MPDRSRALLLLALLLLASLAAVLLSLSLGGLPLSVGEVLQALFAGKAAQGDDQLAAMVVRELRLPRTLAGLACGGLLALAGSLMQLLLRNPLADPYVLGISGGASVGAMAALLLGLPLLFLHGAAFAGALLAMLLVFGLARDDGSWSQSRLLLTGIIIASGCAAIVTLLLSIAPEQQLRSMLFWLMGDLSQASPELVWPALLLLILSLVLLLPLARDLALLARGNTLALSLGVPVARLRLLIYLLASVMTAAAVNVAGSIGFIGLVVPHLVRLALQRSAGHDLRLLLPAITLAGGALLVLADTLARTLIAPQQLPVGVLTALLGVPTFLYLLSRQATEPRQ